VPAKKRPLGERFWSKVSVGKPEDCWAWTAHKTAKGYGRMSMKPSEPVRAHRLAYMLANGAIPPGLSVLHRCDNPPCCNPRHLFLGTIADNNRDMVEKGRSRQSYERGKMTPRKVRLLRAMWASRMYRQRELAEIFNIRRQHVSKVVKRQCWNHVPSDA